MVHHHRYDGKKVPTSEATNDVTKKKKSNATDVTISLLYKTTSTTTVYEYFIGLFNKSAVTLLLQIYSL